MLRSPMMMPSWSRPTSSVVMTICPSMGSGWPWRRWWVFTSPPVLVMIISRCYRIWCTSVSRSFFCSIASTSVPASLMPIRSTGTGITFISGSLLLRLIPWSLPTWWSSISSSFAWTVLRTLFRWPRARTVLSLLLALLALSLVLEVTDDFLDYLVPLLLRVFMVIFWELFLLNSCKVLRVICSIGWLIYINHVPLQLVLDLIFDLILLLLSFCFFFLLSWLFLLLLLFHFLKVIFMNQGLFHRGHF